MLIPLLRMLSGLFTEQQPWLENTLTELRRAAEIGDQARIQQAVDQLESGVPTLRQEMKATAKTQADWGAQLLTELQQLAELTGYAGELARDESTLATQHRTTHLLIEVSYALRRMADTIHKERRARTQAELDRDVAQIEADTDPLTGLLNRRGFARYCEQAIPGSYGLLAVDADYFKQVNDRYGHEVGDQVLRWLATHLKDTGQCAVRLGGEEFALVIPDLDAQHCIDVAKRLRRTVEADKFIVRDQEAELSVTLSIGLTFVTNVTTLATEVNAMIAEADKQLYRAKRTGRNRVCHDIDELA